MIGVLLTAALAAAPTLRFVDVAGDVGLRFQHEAGSKDKRFIAEAMPGGVAWLDHDLDGDWDILLTQAGRGKPPKSGERAPAGLPPALFRNELKPTGELRFTDVTAEVGLDGATGQWGMGVAVADPDGDGDPDIYLTGLGPDRFFRNDLIVDGKRSPRPKFSEVAKPSGLVADGWSTGAAFADVDADGDLDLYVAGYVDFDPAYVPSNAPSSYWKGIEVFPGPVGLSPAPDYLFRNLLVESGELRFEDASEASGLRRSRPYFGFAVLFLDHDGDGDADAYVANDSTPNQLWVNDGEGRFRDAGFAAAVAYGEDGTMQAGMGAAAGDCNGDGATDLFVTNFSYDNYALYRSTGDGLYEDESYGSGLGRATYHALGFGAAFLDADLDGDEDLVVANGHIYPQVDSGRFKTTYAQANQLFENVSTSAPCRFVERTTKAGPGFGIEKVTRGLAVADADGDGDLDVLLGELDDQPTLLRNETRGQGRWLAVRAAGRAPNTWGIGARVTVRVGGKTQVREIRAGESYLSSGPPVAHFGLGAASVADVTVRFPSGRTATTKGVRAGATVTIEEPAGEPTRPSQ